MKRNMHIRVSYMHILGVQACAVGLFAAFAQEHLQSGGGSDPGDTLTAY